MMNFFAAAVSWVTLHWRIVVTACALTIGASFKSLLESDGARAQRLQSKEKKRLRALADKILTYGREVHQRYPTGDVIVSQHDLAEQLGKTPDAVIRALNLLLGERRVQKASLAGYWKLNV
jgi:hypothetical protein